MDKSVVAYKIPAGEKTWRLYVGCVKAIHNYSPGFLYYGFYNYIIFLYGKDAKTVYEN